ncbi:alanine aminotransferase 2-like isoform X1 [Brachyhypopomus gauderio]|uniref:alanine aminotransferase 2-like isoform X1 n=1 Tax=Brachyhypopomus gauderio TaxID=698409 RepID=UPI0040426927
MSVLDESTAEMKRISASVWGNLETRAVQIMAEIQQGVEKPFKEVLDLSCGDPHSLGLKPLTFVRQVLAACLYPPLLDDDTLPADVRERAQMFLGHCVGGSIGSYPECNGITKVQHSVSEFISRRDGATADPDNIYITKGSTEALLMLLRLFAPSAHPLQTGVLTPVPSYKGFTRVLSVQGAAMVPYYLCEEEGWSIQIDDLRKAIQIARRHCNPMALYVVNPGNPTGHLQSKDSIKEVIRFAAEEKLLIIADEVYQNCVYGEGREFFSYKKALVELGPPYCNLVELASINSVSKGAMGECGLRCGYMELVNLDSSMDQNKIFSITPFAPVLGQIALDVMVDPPQPRQPSYPLYTQEVQSIKRATMNNVQKTLEVFNSLTGITLQPIGGGLFAFPRLHMSQAAIDHAQERDLHPDVMYCSRLLEEEGLLILPGSKLGMKKGAHYIRVSLGAHEDMMTEALRRLERFHLRFLHEFPCSALAGGHAHRPAPATPTDLPPPPLCEAL